MQRAGDLFPEAAFQIGIIDAIVGEFLAQVVECFGDAGDFVGRLDHVLQRAGHSQSRAGEQVLGARCGGAGCGFASCIRFLGWRGGWRFCGLGERCFIGADAAEQVAGVGQFFVDGFETLAECELATFEQGEQVGGRDDIERELLAAAGVAGGVLEGDFSASRLYRSAALSESVSRCLGFSSIARLPVAGSTARVSNESNLSSAG